MVFDKLKGSYSLPEDPVIKLPDNKTLQFPLQLFLHPYYRALYEETKTAFLEEYPTGPRPLIQQACIMQCTAAANQL